MRLGRVVIAASLAMSLAAGSALAQGLGAPSDAGGGLPGPGIDLSGQQDTDPVKAEKRREVERAYKDATQKIPAQATGADPWANMRGADEAKPAAKPAVKTTQKKKPQVQ